jgi:hypothetical protein
MECSFDRAPAMAAAGSSGMRRIVLAAFVVAIAWLATARADDLLDRGVAFHIPASPLASALIEFSTQSGVQVAAADADVSHLNSNGVNGTLPIRAALIMLLHGTGLEFSRVGDETIAIRAVSGGPAVGSLARAGASGSAVKRPAAEAAPPDPNMSAGALPDIPDVTVTAPRPPTESELAGDSLSKFVVHHATVHYLNTGVRGNLAHWRGGKQSICPSALGLDPAYNAFVTARLRALAANVGAPVDADLQCKENVRMFFTANPQAIMEDVEKWSSYYFRGHGEYARMRRLIAYSSDHAIQGFYVTTRGGSRVLNADVALLRLNLVPVWPQIIPNWFTDDGDLSGIGIVILVVDTTKIAGYGIGTIADYLSVLSLSVVQSPDNCDPLPSILDVMSSSCGSREKPTSVTAGDLAFLKALYYRNTGLGSSLSRDEIQTNMIRQFKGH